MRESQMTTTRDDAFEAEDETLLFSLIYCSRAVEHLANTEIDRIVAVAQRNNARNDITGLLVFSSGIFFQWLEGRRDCVEELMKSISADARHNTIVILDTTEEVRERVFSGWAMELVSPQDIQAVLLDAIDSSQGSKSTAALQILLKELDSRAVAASAAVHSSSP
jgi:hypothetical protein